MANPPGKDVSRGPFPGMVRRELRPRYGAKTYPFAIGRPSENTIGESFERLYANPLVNVAFTFIEPFPVGILMTLISAFTLRRK